MGVQEGKGKFKYQDGSVYEGDWVNNKRKGTGTLTLKHGNMTEVYVGKWDDDKK